MVRRFEFKHGEDGKWALDPNGDPVDTGDTSHWRLLVMGAVAARGQYLDSTQRTGIIADDLSSGDALASSNCLVKNECDVGRIVGPLPQIDFLWVLDEGASMAALRPGVVKAVEDLHRLAAREDIDFRMGFTGMGVAHGGPGPSGRLCSDAKAQGGGADRFLLSTEEAAGIGCVKHLLGRGAHANDGLVAARRAVIRHLPRAAALARIRPKAALVIIVVTDSAPRSLHAVLGGASALCDLDAARKARVAAAVGPLMDLFSGKKDPEASAHFNVLGGTCRRACAAATAHGYRELASMLWGRSLDICQEDHRLGLRSVLGAVIGSAHPASLDRPAVGASVAVGVNAEVVPRSRRRGFDFRPAYNSLSFASVPLKKGDEVIVSYKRWCCHKCVPRL